MMNDSFLSDAGWLFFCAWSVVIGAVSIAAFGRDLLPLKARRVGPQKTGLQKARAVDTATSGTSTHLAILHGNSLLSTARK